MSLWSAVTGIFKPAKELVEVFKPNAENEAERGHRERLEISRQDLASLEQFAAEFKSKRTSTSWDSFIDGLNRLPRPLITLGILGLFVLAPADPIRFLEIARAYQIMPDGFWALLSIIIAFYFGGRMQMTKQQMTITGGALDAAKEIVKVRKAFRDLADEDHSPTEKVYQEAVETAAPEKRANSVVAAWLQRQENRRPEALTP
ncbi:MAG: holin family protein [Geminicoccaceae bacterium]